MATDIMTVFNSVSPYVFFCSVIMCCSDGQARYASSGILLICRQKSVLFPIKLNHYIVVFSSPIVAYQHKSHINFNERLCADYKIPTKSIAPKGGEYLTCLPYTLIVDLHITPFLIIIPKSFSGYLNH